MSSLEGKVAIVTASTRGIGYAIVEKFAKEGAVVYMACRNLEAGNEKAAGLNAEGYCVKTVLFDPTIEETITGMIDTVVEAEGRVDILVNNYGGTNLKLDRDFMNTKYEDFEGFVNVHLKTVYKASQVACEKSMIPNNGGCIINIGSVAGLCPDCSQISYGTSKAAIIYLSKLISVHTARNNIRCNVVCPGMTATEAVTKNLNDDFMEFFLKHTPIRRMGTAEEIADACLYFANAEYTTGQVIAVAGGFGVPTPTYGDCNATDRSQ